MNPVEGLLGRERGPSYTKRRSCPGPWIASGWARALGEDRGPHFEFLAPDYFPAMTLGTHRALMSLF